MGPLGKGELSVWDYHKEASTRVKKSSIRYLENYHLEKPSQTIACILSDELQSVEFIIPNNNV